MTHVCDDPECDTHRRDTDVEEDMRQSVLRLKELAERCHEMEEHLRAENENASMSSDVRTSVRTSAYAYAQEEKELVELEEELRGIRSPDSRLVPRRPKRA